ncbi:concanavalin A-like lectin/glucanase domain-containing protein [Russula dissimulans]|nr:concanavalin A-like lectin/glucanase domain-containing protein [Russula dissimulans]
MHTSYAFLTSLLLSHALCASASYSLEDQWAGSDFLAGGWIFETADDLTHGRVNYLSQTDAVNNQLAYADNGQFFMHADDVSVVDPAARGRSSIRIHSQKAYDDSIIVLDLEHMPAGCATWPSFWTLSSTGPWPNGGEIDIIEGVNQNTINQATLHTTPNCVMPADSLRQSQTGTTLLTNCDATLSGNQGCGVSFSNSGPSYGTAFNSNGGGYYAMSKSQATGIQVWFWQRGSPSIPPEIIQGPPQGQPFPSSDWGPPVADFPMLAGSCDYESHFNAQQITFDLTFCGDWAGSVWPQSSCASLADSCVDFVNNSPSSFTEAYWAINSLKVYTPQ